MSPTWPSGPHGSCAKTWGTLPRDRGGPGRAGGRGQPPRPAPLHLRGLTSALTRRDRRAPGRARDGGDGGLPPSRPAHRRRPGAGRDLPRRARGPAARTVPRRPRPYHDPRPRSARWDGASCRDRPRARHGPGGCSRGQVAALASLSRPRSEYGEEDRSASLALCVGGYQAQPDAVPHQVCAHFDRDRRTR
jgi:hypothetical protein